MKKLRFIVFIAVALIPVLFLPAGAEYVSDQKGTLRGIEALLIVIGQLPPEVKELGLTREQLRTGVASAVRLAGITAGSISYT